MIYFLMMVICYILNSFLHIKLDIFMYIKVYNCTFIQRKKRTVENFIKNSCIYRKKSDNYYELCHNSP